MAKNSKPKSAKKRVKVQELPTAETKLSEKELKKVKGGGKMEYPNFSRKELSVDRAIVKWDGPDLNATGNDVAMETIEIE